jgi:hypothetical protein
MINNLHLHEVTMPAPQGRRAKLGRRGHRLELPVGEPDPQVLRAFMRECLVPLLAEEFLNRRADAEARDSDANLDKPTIELYGREDGQ